MERGKFWALTGIFIGIVLVISFVSAGLFSRDKPQLSPSTTCTKDDISALSAQLTQRFNALDALINATHPCPLKYQILMVSRISNQTSGTGSYSDDRVEFTDIDTQLLYRATLTSDGQGTIVIGGKLYSITYSGANSISEDDRTLTITGPTGSGLLNSPYQHLHRYNLVVIKL